MLSNFKVLTDYEGEDRPPQTEWLSFSTLLILAPSGPGFGLANLALPSDILGF